jgi:thioredoxin-related protein
MKKIWVSIIVAAILIILIFAIRPVITGNSVNEEREKMDAFAQCITDAGAVMYGTGWCSYCQEQKKEFGKSFKNINFVDCDRNYDMCKEAGVTSYPTWKFKEMTYKGKQSLNGLSRITGCELQ